MPNETDKTWGAPMTARETTLLHLLVAKLGGHSVDLTPLKDGKPDGDAKAGFSVGKGRSVRLEDIAAIFEPGEDGEPVTLGYTNYSGEHAERTIVPVKVWHGSTEWHPEPQWLLKAWDVEKLAYRDFALKDFGSPDAAKINAAIREGVRHALDLAGAGAILCVAYVSDGGIFNSFREDKDLTPVLPADVAKAVFELDGKAKPEPEPEATPAPVSEPYAWLYTHMESEWDAEGREVGKSAVEKVTFEEPDERFRAFNPYSNIRAVYAAPPAANPLRDAAPDMLAALKLAEARLSRPDVYEVYPVAEARTVIGDAIAKAEGRS